MTKSEFNSDIMEIIRCKICGKKYKKMSHMARHLNSYHPNREYGCWETIKYIDIKAEDNDT